MTSVYLIHSGLSGSGPFLEPVQVRDGETRHLTNRLLTTVEPSTGKVHPPSLCFNPWWEESREPIREGSVLLLLHHFVRLSKTKQLLQTAFAIMHHQTQLELATS